MDRFNLEKANDALKIVREQKYVIADWCNLADIYYHNDVADHRQHYPSDYLIQEREEMLPLDNLIPLGTRVWQSIVMGAPFGVEFHPAGSRDPQGLKLQAANGLTNCITTIRTKPDNKRMMRAVSLEALLYNVVAIYDGFNFDAKPYPKPFYKIINWRDLYVDPFANEPVNADDGPCWVCVRCWYTADQIRRMYGSQYIGEGPKALRKGLLMDQGEDRRRTSDQEREAFKDRYHVMHWWGRDVNVVTLGIKFAEQYLDRHFQEIIQGGGPVPEKDEPHRKMVEEGDRRFIDLVNERTEGKVEKLQQAVERAIEGGASRLVDFYARWRLLHFRFVMEEFEGGKRPKYDGDIYYSDFQETSDNTIRGPELSPYKHGQIPVSISRRHEGTYSYWTKGILVEALQKQHGMEYLQRKRDVHLHYEASPFLVAIRDLLPSMYRNPEDGEEVLNQDLMVGNKLVLLDDIPPGANVQNIMAWLHIEPLSGDVKGEIIEKKMALMELFGASEIMRGIGPGAEASGKHIQLRMQAASRPVTFMLSLLQGPLHDHYERLGSNIVNFADPEWLSQMINQEETQAILQVREMKNFSTVLKVNLGEGMPTDWVSRFEIYTQLMALGIYPPQEFTEELNIQVPEGSLQPGPGMGTPGFGRVGGQELPSGA